MEIVYPWQDAPGHGDLQEVGPGVWWTRLPLPQRPHHVNAYIIDDDDGWLVVEAGNGDPQTLALWEKLLTGALAAKPVTRVLITHAHADHVGAAGWLTARTGARLLMTRTEYLAGQLQVVGALGRTSPASAAFLLSHGMPEPVVAAAMAGETAPSLEVGPLPWVFERLRSHDTLTIGGRDWQVITGGGHADEQAMLWCRSDNLLLAADQVIATISPLIAVWSVEPAARPVDDYCQSLRQIRSEIDRDVLVLPGHGSVFRGLHTRIDQLLEHHDRLLARIVDECTGNPRSVGSLLPLLYNPTLPPRMAVWALAEAIAHVNSLLGRGVLRTVTGADGTTLVYA